MGHARAIQPFKTSFSAHGSRAKAAGVFRRFLITTASLLWALSAIVLNKLTAFAFNVLTRTENDHA
jgi:hypothetical protein